MIDKKLLALLSGNKKYIGLIVVSNIIGMVANVTITASICYILKLISQMSSKVSSYLTAAVIILFAVGIKVICVKMQSVWKIKLGAVIKADLRQNIYRKITDVGSAACGGESTAGITQIAVDGVEQLDLYYTVYLPQLFYAMIAPILLFCLCVAIDYRTAIVLLLCVPVIPIAIIGVSKYAKKIFSKYWNQYITIGDGFLDNLQGMQELKIFNADARAQIIMDKRSEEFRKVTMKVLVMQLASITIMDIVAFGGAGLGIAMALGSGVSSDLAPISVLFLILISAEFFLPMRSLGSAFHVAMNGATAGKMIVELLAREDAAWGDLTCTGGDIAFEDVDFAYAEGAKVLDGVTMLFKQKTFSAIVGESGSGKSTAISLIIGKFAANSGNVLMDGRDIRGYCRQSYYSTIALVSYNTFIFGTSIRENFYLANKSASDEDICKALTLVNMQHFLLENGGLDYVISESASNISGGERQRLALAVNLLADKEVYIFDEATSNIDIESESIIMDNIKRLAAEKTVIMISHRLANAALADNIFVLNGGAVAESGNHTKLMQDGEYYSRLYTEQSRLENAYKEGGNA